MLLPCRGQKYFSSPRAGDGSRSPLRIKRFLEEGRMEGEKESVLPSTGEERIRGAYTLRKESKEELVREMLTPA